MIYALIAVNIIICVGIVFIERRNNRMYRKRLESFYRLKQEILDADIAEERREQIKEFMEKFK